MKQMFRDLLSNKSDLSMMRFLSLISLLVAGAIAVYGVAMGRDPIALSALCGVFITGSIGGKVSQKFIEGRQIDGEQTVESPKA